MENIGKKTMDIMYTFKILTPIVINICFSHRWTCKKSDDVSPETIILLISYSICIVVVTYSSTYIFV
jgi:hypothetical protein